VSLVLLLMEQAFEHVMKGSLFEGAKISPCGIVGRYFIPWSRGGAISADCLRIIRWSQAEGGIRGSGSF